MLHLTGVRWEKTEIMNKIRVAQFGTCGTCHADHVMMTMKNLPEYFEIVGICEQNTKRLERAQKCSCYDGLEWLTKEQILNDKTLDAVIVESHELEQDKDALEFAKAGFNIHLEKPGGASECFEKLVKTAKKNGTVLHMGYMYRYNPAVKYAFELAESGKLGKINYVETQMSIYYGMGGLNFLSEFPGGMMYYLGCHLTDIVYRIMGKPKEIIPMNFRTWTRESSALDTGFVIYEYENGYSFAKTSASEVNGDARRQLIISGTRGTVEIMPLENPLEAPGIVSPGDVHMKITYNDCYIGMRNYSIRSEHINFPLYGRYDEMMIDFARKVLGEKEKTYTYEYELEMHRMLMKSVGLNL